MVWHLIKPLVDELSKPFRDASLELMKAEKGVEGNAPQWKTCVVKTDAVMGFATGYLYIKERSGKISKKEVRRFKNFNALMIYMDLTSLSTAYFHWKIEACFTIRKEVVSSIPCTLRGWREALARGDSSVNSSLVGSFVRVPNWLRVLLLYASARTVV